MKKTVIYFGDLVHDSVVKGPFTMPLNIGYVAAYAQKLFGKDVEVRLFKYPLPLIEAIKEEAPDILALGNYSWNADLNYRIFQRVKALSSGTVCVLGGPNFPIDKDERHDRLAARPLVDLYVVDQGEEGFSGFLERYLEVSGDMKRVKDAPLRGCVFLRGGKLISGSDAMTIASLDDIPSPYLSGMLDEFFGGNLIPIIETDRGCPYTCTFCAWGKNTSHKIMQFGMPRVMAELDYIVKHVKHTNMLFIANANFGIFERDEEIARRIRDHAVSSGYPRRVDAAWAKDKPKRIIGIAETLGEAVEITMSFQSLDPLVLKNIKRSNIGVSSFMEIQDYFRKKGVVSASELILGLPGETRESHLKALRALFDMGAANMINYNCRTLDGSVLGTRAERKRHGIKTKFRLYDIGFGKYDDIVSIEADEVVRSTGSLSEEEMLFFRSLHWLIQFLWSFTYYIHLLRYLWSKGIHPLDFILSVASERDSAPADLKAVFDGFEKDAVGEWFETPEKLFGHYAKEENFKAIMGGGFGKLNYKYTYMVLYGVRDSFDRYLDALARKLAGEKLRGEEQSRAEGAIGQLIRYMRCASVEFDRQMRFDEEKKASFDYDILRWEKDGFTRPLDDYKADPPVTYRFHMPGHQRQALDNNIRQFRHQDGNLTIRKMCEYMKKSDLFYKVSALDGDAAWKYR